jgi:hypothetical protein
MLKKSQIASCGAVLDKQSGIKFWLLRQGETTLRSIGLVAVPSAKPFWHFGRRNRPEDFINTSAICGHWWQFSARARAGPRNLP